jgi:hypothetical protein
MKSRRRNNSRKHKKTHKRRTYKRGGGFFDFFSSKSATVVPENCNPNNLSQLKSSQQLRENYQTCCPKTMFGLKKNSSPYCKQIELNMNAAVKGEGLEKEYVGMDPMEVAALRNVPGAQGVPNPAPIAPMPAPAVVPAANENIATVGGRRRRRTRKNRRYRKK